MYWIFPHCQSDVPEGVIRVHAPRLSKVSMAIQLSSQTKAKDILAKFQYESRWVKVNKGLCTKMMNFYQRVIFQEFTNLAFLKN